MGRDSDNSHGGYPRGSQIMGDGPRYHCGEGLILQEDDDGLLGHEKPLAHVAMEGERKRQGDQEPVQT